MAYSPTTWATGDTATATKMNKLEQGLANVANTEKALIITDNGTSLNKTFAEICNALHSGTPCYVWYEETSDNDGLDISDLDITYSYTSSLAPVICTVKYDMNYRIYVSSARSGNYSGVNMLGTPAIWTYQVTSSSDYPTFLRRVTVNTTYCAVDTYR